MNMRRWGAIFCIATTCFSWCVPQYHFAVQTNDDKLKAVDAKKAIIAAIDTIDPQLLACALDECARTGEPVHLLPILKQLNTHIEYYHSTRHELRGHGSGLEIGVGMGLIYAAFVKCIRYIGFAGTLVFIDGIHRMIKFAGEEIPLTEHKPRFLYGAANRLSELLDVLRARKDMLLVNATDELHVKLERKQLKNLLPWIEL